MTLTMCGPMLTVYIDLTSTAIAPIPASLHLLNFNDLVSHESRQAYPVTLSYLVNPCLFTVIEGNIQSDTVIL